MMVYTSHFTPHTSKLFHRRPSFGAHTFFGHPPEIRFVSLAARGTPSQFFFPKTRGLLKIRHLPDVRGLFQIHNPASIW